jgi:hypothetical protein
MSINTRVTTELPASQYIPAVHGGPLHRALHLLCILLDRCESLLLGKCIETSFASAVNAARMLVQLFLPYLLIHQHIGGSVGVYAMLLQPPRLPLCMQCISYSAIIPHSLVHSGMSHSFCRISYVRRRTWACRAIDFVGRLLLLDTKEEQAQPKVAGKAPRKVACMASGTAADWPSADGKHR